MKLLWYLQVLDFAIADLQQMKMARSSNMKHSQLVHILNVVLISILSLCIH